MSKAVQDVIVVGAGPVGLLAALMLARHGVRVEVLEAEKGIDQRPRGLGYGPAAVKTLREAGILDKAREKGLGIDSIGWRRPGGKLVAEMSGLADPNYENRWVALPVHLLAEIMRDEFMKLPGAKIHWGTKVNTITQDEDKAHVHATEADDLETTYTGDYVIGCDGASSIVRKTLFGHSFPGSTWEQQIVALNVYSDHLNDAGWADLQFIIDAEDWGIVTRVDGNGQWRVSYGDKNGLNMQQLKERVGMKLENILPGHPKRDDYRLVNFSPYRVHQRCAEHLRVGRVLLAGDAAHLTNPMGGLGLTTGISDVGSLIQCLVGIKEGKAGLEILDKYDEMRRDRFNNFTSPTATTNLKRLFKSDEASLQHDPVLNKVRGASNDPQEAVKLLSQEEAIAADMTKYYTG